MNIYFQYSDKPKRRPRPCQQKCQFFMQCSKWLEQCVTEKFNSIFRIFMKDIKFFSHRSPKWIEFYYGYEEGTYQWKKIILEFKLKHSSAICISIKFKNFLKVKTEADITWKSKIHSWADLNWYFDLLFWVQLMYNNWT